MMARSGPSSSGSVDGTSSRGMLIEKKIEYLESLAAKVSKRRSRKWLNDQLLLELVPPLNAEEIRSLFSPPPWGDNTWSSPFGLVNLADGGTLLNADMDSEVSIVGALDIPPARDVVDVMGKNLTVMRAWQRVDRRSRVSLKRFCQTKLIEQYENLICSYLDGNNDQDVLELKVEDPFHRLMLHGICEFYELKSVTVDKATNSKESSKVMQIKKKAGHRDAPEMKLTQFLRLAKRQPDKPPRVAQSL